MKSISGTVQYQKEPKLFFATRNNKFPREKVNFENDDYLIHFDGVILNSDELYKNYNCSNNCDVILKLYEKFDSEIAFHIKGVYALSLWDKQKQRILITNDLLSKRSIYYHLCENGLFFAGSYRDLLDMLTHTDYTPSINTSAIKAMTEHGFLTGNMTYLNDVFYLNAFECISIDINTSKTEILHLQRKTMNVPEEENAMITEFDALFTKAVKLQNQKNKEYGYQYVASLSGGMDSRSCLLKGIASGYKDNILCFTYAQSGSLDFQISQQIAKDYRLDYLFYPMDSALFLNRIKCAMDCNEYQQSAVGSTAANIVAHLLNTEPCGIIRAGICGGELMGDLVFVKGRSKDSNLKKAVRLLKGNKKGTEYSFNQNLLIDHLRASQNFSYMFLENCEVVSPFMDEDVFMFVTQMNPKYLYGRRFYTQWMKHFIPNPYIMTHTCCSIDSSPLKVVTKKFLYLIQKKLKRNSIKEMNPFNYWFHTMPEYKESFNKQFSELFRLLITNKTTKEAAYLAKAMWSDNWMKNAYVLTALYAIDDINKLFDKEN